MAVALAAPARPAFGSQFACLSLILDPLTFYLPIHSSSLDNRGGRLQNPLLQTSGRRSGYGSGAGRGCPSTRPRRTRIYVAARSQPPYDTRRGQSCRMMYCGPGPGESGPGGPDRAGRARPTKPTRGGQPQPCGCPRTELQNELLCGEFGQADRELRPGIQVVSAGRDPERGESQDPGLSNPTR